MTLPNPVVFISYSHDSEQQISKVLQLVNLLREHGIECIIDQQEESPIEGWPLWMFHQIMRSNFVLVVSSEGYLSKLEGRTTTGKGCKWEGYLITQEIYESGAQNAKYIPIVLNSEDIRFIPLFLKGSHYDVSNINSYNRLLARLTSQSIRTQDLGSAPLESRSVESKPSFQNSSINPAKLAVLLSEEGKLYSFSFQSIKRDRTIEVHIDSPDPVGASFLKDLASINNSPIAIAFGLTAEQGHVLKAKQTIDNANERWELLVEPDDTDFGAGAFEMSFGKYSADEIAEMRARRILLNEKLPTNEPSSGNEEINSAMLEVLVRGIDVALG